MTENFVTLEIRDGVGALTIDRPPVNALSHDLRRQLFDKLQAIKGDTSIEGLVLACAGRTFVAGTDIAELGQNVSPMLPEVIGLLEGLGVPSVAALHGTALGGGFELSLGCTFRVALRSTKVGLPEVTLGFLPGAGGTVRTTYLTGAETALKLAGSGWRMTGEEAHEVGLIDAVFGDDIVEEAAKFLRHRIQQGALPAPLAQRREKIQLSDLEKLPAITTGLRRKLRSSAPDLVEQSVRNAVEMSFEDALKAERQLFLEAVISPRSVALRHLFFAERAAAKPIGDTAAAEPRQIQIVGVIGAGTMGSGIAMAFANSGFDVVLCEINDEALQNGLTRIEQSYQRAAARGSITLQEMGQRILRITAATALDDLASCDLIVEAAFEDMAVKKEIFTALDAIAKPDAILATNTSYLDVNEIAAITKRPQDVVGLHFFSPANLMKLLEIVQAERTAPEVIATALKVARKLGKQAVVVGVCNGFVGNRMLAARNSQLSSLMLEGATPEQIDGAFMDLGWPMGPCQMQDLAGLDISWRNRKAMGRTDALPDRLCELGRFGQKTGEGWYLYEEGKRTPLPGGNVINIIEELSAANDIVRRTVTAEEIIERTHGPMIAEGHKILEEGIVARASDIDVIWVNGYGFPRDLGGPMFWDAQQRG